MKNKLHYSPESRRDIDEIWAYIALDLENPIAAERVVTDILDTVDQLIDYSQSGSTLSSIADVESDYRFLVSGSYLIFCRECDGEVFVDRVLYGRRDFLRILFGDIAAEE